ncbi:hypothetical protein N431DRAFT_444025 [Stipitochalara longipes BDJ]|nr:hypothetical protein N431DRAFT_444025 [Stipitochalara longipes BDJ]
MWMFQRRWVQGRDRVPAEAATCDGGAIQTLRAAQEVLLPSDNGRLFAKCRGSVAELAELSGNSRVPGPMQEAGAQMKDGVQRLHEGIKCLAQPGKKGARRRPSHACFEGRGNNADAKQNARWRTRQICYLGWSGRDAVCGRATVQSVQSDLTRSERACFVSIQTLHCGDEDEGWLSWLTIVKDGRKVRTTAG